MAGKKSTLYKSSTYNVWANMKQRCLNTKHPQWKDYGGRGITICEKWLTFENFAADMGERPGQLTLDRIDNDDGYGPNNCRWASRHDQRVNGRRRPLERLIAFNGKSQTCNAWALEYGLKQATLRCRLICGWPIEMALTSPVTGEKRIKRKRNRLGQFTAE